MQRKEANPLIWGACGAIGVVTLVTVGGLLGYRPASSEMSFTALTAAGFFWFWLMGIIWNKLGNRRPRL